MTNSSNPHARLYLASASLRRRELLAQVGLQALVLPQYIDESIRPNESPDVYVVRVAAEKAAAALLDPARKLQLPVLAADTAVVCDGQVLGKPSSLQDAMLTLGLLSGRSHQVLTAVVLADTQQCVQTLVSTTVTFRTIQEEEMAAYWATGEPCDKAGAYGIQGLGAMFVSHISGSYSAVVGLPLFETLGMLAEFGISSTAVLKEQAA